MILTCCGMSHKTAPIQEREIFQLQRPQLSEAARRFKQISGAEEAVLLATCNRVEFYCAQPEESDPRRAVQDFYHLQAVAPAPVGDHWFVRRGSSVARHLFKVTAGLDSPMLGESQVLGQVKSGYSAACESQGPGRLLHKLFHYAFRAAKLIHTDTDVGRGVHGLAGAAVDCIQRHFDNRLEGLGAIVVGVNSSSELILSRLAQANVALTVANRTLLKAERLAKSCRARAISLEDLKGPICEADILVSATSALGFMIRPEHLTGDRAHRPLLMIDLASPRDIDPAIGNLQGVSLMDLDDLKRSLETQTQARSADLPRALAIIEEQVVEFERWRRANSNGGLGTGLRALLEEDRREILERYAGQFHNGELKALEALSHSLCRQFLRRIAGQIPPPEPVPHESDRAE
jgi:glutamyl-tRNA reductase